MSDSTYDAIIIGAGIGGLVCGCYLAKAGMKVLICEQHIKPGGYCTSFKRQGFTFDAAAHSFGSYREGGNLKKILTDLGIDKMLEIKRFNPSDVIIGPDCRITYWNDPEQTYQDLVNKFPHEHINLKLFFLFCNRLLAGDYQANLKIKNKSFSDLLKSFFSDKKLINLLITPIFGNGGLPPSLMHAFTGMKILTEFLMDGGYYIEGGMQKLPDAFSKVIESHKGKILFKKKVKKIIYNNKNVIGIQLNSNEKFLGKYIIAACDVNQVYKKLLGKEIVGADLLKKLQFMETSLSSFMLYIGLQGDFANLPPEGVNLWYLPYYDIEKMYEYISNCQFDKIGFMIRVSPDKKTIIGYFLAPFKSKLYWERNKIKIAEQFLNKLEILIPSLKKHVSVYEAASPYTLYRYTLNTRGSNYGWAPTTSQLFDTDFTIKTKFKGLYLTGHWTAVTHGIPGVSYLGYNTARLILREEGIKNA